MIINDPNGIIGNLEINTLPGANNIANYLRAPFSLELFDNCLSRFPFFLSREKAYQPVL